MLFNSLPFLFLFLPVAVAGFFMAGRWNVVFLSLASLAFYACWHAPDLLLLLGSIGVNYLLGARLQQEPSRGLLAFGICANLLVIAWFKYAAFVAANVNALTGAALPLPSVILPLGVSFFTIHEITWLVDSHRGKIGRHAPFSHYVLYIAFFPQLIAGPIVRYTEVMHQYAAKAFGRVDPARCAQGALLFCMGLCKKVLLADYFATVATPLFGASGGGLSLTAAQAWAAAVAYSFQIYFDFSGYSDMALGLGLVFGIVLPPNFNSPYKAVSIIDFWRRWHMTLSRFLRDYLYIPLGGGTGGPLRQAVNLMAVMLIGGLWHGAAWTFVIWGGLHGLYLVVNHLWRRAFPREGGVLAAACGGVLTFLAVAAAWVFFRAESVGSALSLLRSMAGLGGEGPGMAFSPLALPMAIVGGAIIWCLPNAQDTAGRFFSEGGRGWRLRSLAVGAATALAVFLTFTGVESEFIYFQF